MSTLFPSRMACRDWSDANAAGLNFLYDLFMIPIHRDLNFGYQRTQMEGFGSKIFRVFPVAFSIKLDH